MAVISPGLIDDIERRRDNIRRVWQYRRVDHIPVMLRVESNPWGYTTREHFLDGDKQFQLELEKVRLSLELVPDDYIPSMRPDVGCVVIESCLLFYETIDSTCSTTNSKQSSNRCTGALVPQRSHCLQPCWPWRHCCKRMQRSLMQKPSSLPS